MQPPRELVPAEQRRSNFRRAGLLLLLGGLLVTLPTGCSSKRAFTPRNLPTSWHARPTTNARTVGLGKLAADSRPLDQIGKGDVLEVNLAAGLLKEESSNFAMRINDHGYGILPDVGPVFLDGMTLEAAETAIRKECIQREYIRNPHVTVTMKERKTIQVTVLGAVEKEGTYRLPSGSAGVSQAIALAGGLAKDAGANVEVSYGRPQGVEPDPLIARADGSTRMDGSSTEDHALAGHQVPVRTGGGQSFKINLVSMASNELERAELKDGATIQIERIDPQQVTVQGLVNKPGTFDFVPGKELRILGAISQAGGESSLTADKVYVIRHRQEQPEPALIQVSIRRAKRNGRENLLLEPGDIVTVEQTPATVFLETLRMIGFNLSARAL